MKKGKKIGKKTTNVLIVRNKNLKYKYGFWRN